MDRASPRSGALCGGLRAQSIQPLCQPLLDGGREEGADSGIDLAGALIVAASLVAAVYAIVRTNAVGRGSVQTISLRDVEPGWTSAQY